MSRNGGEAANEGIACKMARGLAVLATMALWMMALAGPAWASQAFVTVTNTNDSGEGSLREAISLSNSLPTDTPKRIEFAIPETDPGYDPASGVVTISPTSPLPEIEYPLFVDGYSQPGAQANTLAVGNDAEIKVVLDGSRAGSAHGLQITEHAGSTVRGLAINRFSGSGIVLWGGGATGNKIEGNRIGTDASGGQDLGNGSYGVYLRYARQNTIGGTSPAARNVISGNGSHGVFVHDAFNHPTSNLVQGNYIGTDKGGSKALGNDLSGVYLLGVDGDAVGGTQPGAGNVVSGNKKDGVAVVGLHGYYRSYARIEGNRIGTDASDGQDLGNGGSGVSISDSANNVVGGTQQGAGNVISHNGGAGVNLEGWYAQENRVEANELSFNDGDGIRVGTGGFNNGLPATNNALLANSTRSNGGLGVDLGDDGVTQNDDGDGDGTGSGAWGANSLQNFPVLTSVEESADGSFSVRGELDSLPNTGFAIEVFGNDESTGQDPSGYGEGRSFLGRVDVTTDAGGHAAFSLGVDKLPGGTYAATATNKQAGAGPGETSELGPVLPERRPPPQCDDGEDNDGDGKTDFGGENPDPGCQDSSDNSEDSDKTFTVDTTADGHDVGPGDGRCNTDVPAGSPCTLRAAIEEANATSAPDKVILPAGRYELAAASEGLVVREDLTLVGAGARSTTIAGGEGFTSSVLLPWYGASVRVSGVTISGGGGDYYGYFSQGGGVYNLGKLSLLESAVVGNSASFGGGIYSEGPLEILASTIAGNTTPDSVAGVYHYNAPITVANSTISGNTAAGEGGGLVVGGDLGALKMTNSTVASNTSGSAGGGVLTFGSATATIENSIIWGNGAGDCDSAANGGGAITSGGGNVSGDASCGFTRADDQQNTDPLLGPLADNGGPTDTRAPTGDSPAVDAGLTPACPAADQRGVARPQEGDGVGGAACDAGAYELRHEGPTANHDSYETSQNGTLAVPAPGPLANDADPEDEALSAAMVSDVSHGALDLRDDGSFTYTPAAGFVGRDTFTYKASDGASSSGAATVEILVKDTASPTIESVAPAGRKVSPKANVTAVFSEAMDAETIDTATVKLTKKGARSPIPATVSYDPATMKAKLDPAKPLVKGTTYTATVSTGVQDTAGNALAATKSWRFTVKS